MVALDEGLEESPSESLLMSIDTMTSFIPEVFSCEDSRSSGGGGAERLDEFTLWTEPTGNLALHPNKLLQ